MAFWRIHIELGAFRFPVEQCERDALSRGACVYAFQRVRRLELLLLFLCQAIIQYGRELPHLFWEFAQALPVDPSLNHTLIALFVGRQVVAIDEPGTEATGGDDETGKPRNNPP